MDGMKETSFMQLHKIFLSKVLLLQNGDWNQVATVVYNQIQDIIMVPRFLRFVLNFCSVKLFILDATGI